MSHFRSFSTGHLQLNRYRNCLLRNCRLRNCRLRNCRHHNCTHRSCRPWPRYGNCMHFQDFSIVTLFHPCPTVHYSQTVFYFGVWSLEMNRNFRSCRKLCSRLSQADTLAGDKPQSKKLDMEDTSADFRSQPEIEREREKCITVGFVAFTSRESQCSGAVLNVIRVTCWHPCQRVRLRWLKDAQIFLDSSGKAANHCLS